MSISVTDEQVTRAVAVWDQARCRVNELWHGGKCEPCSDVHRKNVEPMFRPVLEDFVSSLSTPDAPSAAPGSLRATANIAYSLAQAAPSAAPDAPPVDPVAGDGTHEAILKKALWDIRAKMREQVEVEVEDDEGTYLVTLDEGVMLRDIDNILSAALSAVSPAPETSRSRQEGS